MNSCLKKTELLYKSARETHNLYSTPHILTSSLLKFPFSAAYLFLKEMGEPSTALIDTSLLLLDLHLPKEAIQILELECDMFSTAFDNKWAQAKANELLMDYKLGEVWLRENLSITKDEPMSWLLMGHNRYISGQFAEALEAYEQVKTFLPVLCTLDTNLLILQIFYISLGKCIEVGSACAALAIPRKESNISLCPPRHGELSPSTEKL